MAAGLRFGLAYPTGFELEMIKDDGEGKQFEVIDISKLKNIGE